MKHWTDALKSMQPCPEAVEWAKGYKSLEEAWAACERGDHMLWLLGKQVMPGSEEHKKLVFTACQCARLALLHVTAGEDRPRLAIEAAEAWTRGEATLDYVKGAAHAAAHAAADAAHAAADAAAHAAHAAYAAAHAAHAAADAAAVLRQCADIVRKYHPAPVLRETK